jgi:Xaa-Pro aminopeptidase
MERENVDCLFLTGVENFSYFNGTATTLYQQRRPWCLLLPLETDPIVLTMAGTDVTLLAEGYVKDVRSYELPVTPNLSQRIERTLREVKAARIACELGLEQRLEMPLSDFDAVRAAMPDAQFVDAAPIIWSLRMLKSAEEIERMRAACQIVSATRQEMYRRVSEGMTERAVADEWARLMVEAGADRPAFVFVNSGGAPNFFPKRAKRLRRGDTLWLDAGAYVQDYTCDFSRIATLGKASDEQRKLHLDAVEVTQLVLDAVAPGVPVAALAEVCGREMVARGHAPPATAARTVAGHGMGMITNEPPLVASWDETVLSEGLVTGIELGPLGEAGMFIWEEIIQVTATGYELLTTEGSELVEIEL